MYSMEMMEVELGVFLCYRGHHVLIVLDTLGYDQFRVGHIGILVQLDGHLLLENKQSIKLLGNLSSRKR